jgi:dipeptidyl aminopeptidase/acylaminoacyl peptidase
MPKIRSSDVLVTVCVGVSLAVAQSARAQTRGFEPADYYKIVTVSDVAMAPLGDMVAFTVTRIVEGENRRRREVWVQPLQNGRPGGDAYRFSDPTEETHSPKWSPDGSMLSFQSLRGSDRNPTWFVRVTGLGGEAFHIQGVEGEPVWSADGQWIAYITPGGEADEPAREQSREGWISPDAVSATLDPDRFDGRVITSSRYKEDGKLELRPHWSVRDPGQLYVVSARGGTARRLTNLPFDKGHAQWSPDGRLIFFTGDENQNDESRERRATDIWVVQVTDGSAMRITSGSAVDSVPVLSPDGTRMAYLQSRGRGSEIDIMVSEIGPDGRFVGPPLNVTETWDLEPDPPEWSADGTGILFTARTGGNTHLFRVAATGGPVVQLTRGERRLSDVSFSDRGHVMAYTVTDAVTPTELYVARGDGSGEQKATSFNDDWLRRIELVRPERLSWTVGDSTAIEGWLIPPVDYRPGRVYPMVLKIHGGPHSQYGNYFFPTFHVLSNAGFFVLYTNPRGSSGYGHDFMYATRGRWGQMDSEDYLGGVDAALARYPDIDAGRLGVSGGSYGGFITNWLTATTDRFSAAVTSRSIANWESWWGSSDLQELTEYEFFGAPWERRDLYRRLSPISYVENVRAPTLVILSEQDYRTPVGDGEQWFMALKKLGVPVEMVRYPRSSHALSRTGEPWLLVDRLERIRSWFVYWLIEQPATVAAGG